MRCYRKILHSSYKDQRGSPFQDPAGNWTTRRLPDHYKETHTAVVWWCLPFIRSGQNHLARHNERGKKTRQTKEEVRRQHQGMDRPGVRQVTEGSGEQGKMGKKWLRNHLSLAVKGHMRWDIANRRSFTCCSLACSRFYHFLSFWSFLARYPSRSKHLTFQCRDCRKIILLNPFLLYSGANEVER